MPERLNVGLVCVESDVVRTSLIATDSNSYQKFAVLFKIITKIVIDWYVFGTFYRKKSFKFI